MKFSELGNLGAFTETSCKQFIFFFTPWQTLVSFFGEGFELVNGEEKCSDDFGLVVWAVSREYFSGCWVGASGKGM